MFFILPGGGIPLFVCGITQKKSVDLHFLVMTSSSLYFLQSPKYTNSFFSVSSHFTTAFCVVVNADNMSKMNPMFSMIFHTNTITSWIPSSLFPKIERWFKMMQYCTSNWLLPVAIPHLLLCHLFGQKSYIERYPSVERSHICINHLCSHTLSNFHKHQVFQYAL